MRNPVTVDGVELDDVCYAVTTRTGWRTSPAVRASQIQTATGDGVLVPERRAPLQPGQVSLTMWVRGSDYSELTAVLDMLFALFNTQRGPVPVTIDVGGGQVRTAMARTIATITPDHSAPLHAKLTAVMEIPSGRWEAADYYVSAWEYADADEALTVICGDPTAEIVDHQLLLRVPGTGIVFTVWDGNVDTAATRRIWAELRLTAPIASGRSLLFDFGRWTCHEIARPTLAGADADWFTSPPAVLVDHTAHILRQGPMYGGCLLPLLPGAAGRPPRAPALGVDAIDDDDLPTAITSAVWAVRPAWL